MSNLIKSVYFNVDPTKVRVIDSDEKVEEYIPEIYDTKKQEEPFVFPALDGTSEEMAFEGGMPSIISIQDVVDEEREKLTRQLQAEQEDLMDTAKQEAEQLVEQARQEADSIRDVARQEGFAAGLEEGRRQAEQELMESRGQLQAEFDERMEELVKQEEQLEPEFAELVIALVRKLTGVICEDKKEVILYLIGNAIRHLERPKQITIRVPNEDMERVSAKRAIFKKLAGLEELDITEDAGLENNQCIIETESRIIDCSLDAQLQNLEEQIKLLAY